MSLEQDVRSWDGKSADVIGEFYERHHDSGVFAETLVTFIHDVTLQKGATWLLKRYLDSGRRLTSTQTHSVFRCLRGLECWEARLHALQCLPSLTISGRNKKKVDKFLRECIDSENKFVRAWAYGGFHELAKQHVEYQEEVQQLLASASKTEAASVRARIRNLR